MDIHTKRVKIFALFSCVLLIRKVRTGVVFGEMLFGTVVGVGGDGSVAGEIAGQIK